MKTFQQIGTEHGELVARKNAAYGGSFARCGDFLRLLYPDGMQPAQYEDALLLVRIFDKQMRIATDREALGENPYADILGYGILGVHHHQSKEEDSTTWQGSASGPAAADSSKNEPPVSAETPASAPTAASTTARTAPEPSPQPDGCSTPLTSAPANTAPATASAAAAGHDVAREILERLEKEGSLDWIELSNLRGPLFATMTTALEQQRVIRTAGRIATLTDLGRASLHASRIAEKPKVVVTNAVTRISKASFDVAFDRNMRELCARSECAAELQQTSLKLATMEDETRRSTFGFCTFFCCNKFRTDHAIIGVQP